MKILIVKTSSLGDVVHNLPMISDLHAHMPEAQIDWLVESAFADIPALHPAIRTVIPINLRRWLRAPGQAETWRALGALRKRLRGETYDVILDSQGLIKSAIISHLARGPIYGPDARSAREPLAALFYQRGLPMRRGQHAVWRNRALGAEAFGYTLPRTPPTYGLRTASGDPPSDKPTCVAFHATSRASKLWPTTHWIDLGKALVDRGIHMLFPSGSESEHETAQAIAQAIGTNASALARMGIRDLAQVISRAQFTIGVDTGLVHLAAALKRPTVGVFCDSDPALTGVLAENHVINLGGFHERPSVEAVLTALQGMGAI